MLEEFETFLKDIQGEDSKAKPTTCDKGTQCDPIIVESESEPEKPEPHRTYFTDRMVIESYKAMMKQMIGMPIDLPRFITINGIGRHLISFEDLEKKLSSGQIEKCQIDPSLQVWAGPEGTQNVFLTVHDTNGTIYMAKVFYDVALGKAYPPVQDHDFSNLWS